MMQRRTVLGIGMAGLAVGILPIGESLANRDVDTALRVLVSARADAGLPQLTLQPDLSAAAQVHAWYMAGSGRASHIDAIGRDPVARARRTGYRGIILGEALAETFDGPVETVAFWLEHRPTREVLLDPAAWDLGLAMARDPDGRMWWDLILGA